MHRSRIALAILPVTPLIACACGGVNPEQAPDPTSLAAPSLTVQELVPIGSGTGVRPPPVVTITAIAAGGANACELSSLGIMDCWGDNTYGQLGVGEAASELQFSYAAQRVSNLTGVQSIAVGGTSACAILSGGTVWCWGNNTNGQLGNGTTQSSSVPVQVTGLTGATAVAIGDSFACATVGSGQSTNVECWGWENLGSAPLLSPQLTPHNVEPGADGVVAGGGAACMLLQDGSAGIVQCFGFDIPAFSPSPSATSASSSTSEPTDIYYSLLATGLAEGGRFTSAIVDGAVWGWGDNTYGQLGNGSTIYSQPPVQVTGLSGVVSIAAGTTHACALEQNGTVSCWGDNSTGALGNGISSPGNPAVTTPVNVCAPGASAPCSKLLTGVKALAAGQGFTCALLSTGPTCWGTNDRGQLGRNPTP
jgi:alpha-tubulin suppressor-like RCC1 family protein